MDDFWGRLTAGAFEEFGEVVHIKGRSPASAFNYNFDGRSVESRAVQGEPLYVLQKNHINLITQYFDEYGAVKNNRDRCRFYQAPSSCRFIHPSDLEWRIVQSPPRRRDSGYSARNRSRSRSPIRRRSLSKDSTRDRYPSRRPSSIESDRFSRRRDRSSSIAEPRLSRTDTLQSPVVPTGPRRLSVDQPPSTTSIVSSATVEDMKPAMPPPAIPAAEPKPVLPSSEDIRKIWITRIKCVISELHLFIYSRSITG